MNNVVITGGLTKDVTLRKVNTKNGERSVASLNVAVNEGFGDKKTTTYFVVNVWDKVAENCEKYLSKGKKVLVSGPVRIDQREYQGKTYVNLVIDAKDIEFLSPASEQKTDNAMPNYDAAAVQEVDEQDEMPF